MTESVSPLTPDELPTYKLRHRIAGELNTVIHTGTGDRIRRNSYPYGFRRVDYLLRKGLIEPTDTAGTYRISPLGHALLENERHEQAERAKRPRKWGRTTPRTDESADARSELELTASRGLPPARDITGKPSDRRKMPRHPSAP